jgi:hypothetical protein
MAEKQYNDTGHPTSTKWGHKLNSHGGNYWDTSGWSYNGYGLMHCWDPMNPKCYGGANTDNTVIKDAMGTTNSLILSDGATCNGKTIYLSGGGNPDGDPAGQHLTLVNAISTLDYTGAGSTGTGMTWDFWFKTISANRMRLVHGASGTLDFIELSSGNSNSAYVIAESSTNNHHVNSTTITDGQGNNGITAGEWNNLTIGFGSDSPRRIYYYYNGHLFHTDNDGLNDGGGGTSEKMTITKIGRSGGTPSYQYGYSFAGHIGFIGIYNRLIGSTAVERNFNCMRKRYEGLKENEEGL